MNVVIGQLTKQQILKVIAARRSMSIPVVSKAARTAGDVLLQDKTAHDLLTMTTNLATRNCREAEVSDAHNIITFQVTACEYVTAVQVKEQISEADYGILTYPFRVAMEEAAGPAEAPSKAATATNGTARRSKRPPAPKPATGRTAPKPKATQPSQQEIADFVKEMQGKK